MSVHPGEILNECAVQQIRLSSSLIETIQSRPNDTNLLYAVRSAGEELRKWPHQVAEGVFSTEKWDSDFLATTLGRLINGRMVPVGKTTPNYRGTDGMVLNKHRCSFADYAFADTFARIISQHGQSEISFKGIGCEIIQKDGVPYFFRKTRGVATDLSLLPVAIDGTVYPAGSIMQVDTATLIKRQFPHDPSNVLKVVAEHDITGMAFGRLSLFAVPVDERMELFGDTAHPLYSYNRAQRAVANFRMEQLVEVCTELIADDHAQSG